MKYKKLTVRDWIFILENVKNERKFRKLEKLFVKITKPEQLLQFLDKYFGRIELNIKLYQDKIVLSQNGFLNYYFAYIFANDDIDLTKTEQAVIDSKNLMSNLLYAQNIKNANIEAHQRVILNSKNVGFCKVFAKKVAGADVEKINNTIALILNNKEKYEEFID